MKGKVNQKVMIYEDPISKKRPEGEAILRKFIDDLGGGLERWIVKFPEEKTGYGRLIHFGGEL
jgi:hypothetical protein